MTSVLKPGRANILRKLPALLTAAVCVVPLMTLAAGAQSPDHTDTLDVATVQEFAQMAGTPGSGAEMTDEDAAGRIAEAEFTKNPWRPVRWYGLSE